MTNKVVRAVTCVLLIKCLYVDPACQHVAPSILSVRHHSGLFTNVTHRSSSSYTVSLIE